MSSYYFLTAWTIGFIGSLHCIGMCGPIHLSLISSSISRSRLYIKGGFFHFGRITAYSLMGLMVAVIEKPFQAGSVQHYISIIAGCSLILHACAQILKVKIPPLVLDPLNQLIWKKWIKWIKSPKPEMFFFIGLLNGVLPCGLVYTALLSSTGGSSALDTALYMVFFGLGTIPALFAVAIFSKLFLAHIRSKVLALTPYLLIFIGILIILRSLTTKLPQHSPHVFF